METKQNGQPYVLFCEVVCTLGCFSTRAPDQKNKIQFLLILTSADDASERGETRVRSINMW